jgi:hypothetical protein
MSVPLLFVAVLFVYHWYDKLPVPPATANERGAVNALPMHKVCGDSGCVEMEGSAITVTATMFDNRLEHPPPENVIST